MANIYFLIIDFIYLVLVMFVYFRKQRINTLENKIFAFLINTSFIGVILDFISVYMAFSGNHNMVFNIINRCYLVYLLSWISLMTAYCVSISTSENKYKRIFSVIKILYVPMVIFLLAYPLSYSVKGNEFYTYGLSADVMYLLSGIYTLIMFICLIINFGNIKQKKYVPIIFYISVGMVVTGVQLTNPSLLIITTMEAFITILMSFTIENPDVKMIEQLDAAKKQADKANQAKSDFLSSMSHEIRTPLNAIVGFSQVLDEDQSLSPEAKEEVKDIIMASNSLLEIVNGILDISKIESGKIEIVNQEYSFKEIFDNLVLLTKARLGDKKLDFRYIYDDSIPAVIYGDHTRVKQVILNILTNAVKYTREGFVEFRVSSIIKDDICRLIISVEDSGIGIKEENIDKLFSKFERLDLDKNITIEGTGLGMAITKKLLELMNGKIVVQSVYGKGSKFTVSIDQRIIKMKEETPVEVLDTPTKEEKNIETVDKKVLIVDDNKINLKVASKLLEGYNFNITTADSGNACIELLKQSNSYDIILMDDMMPGMSGVETLHKIKEEYSNFTTPVIALTANAITGVREKYLNEGFNDYLAKPIDKGELNNLIAKYFSK